MNRLPYYRSSSVRGNDGTAFRTVYSKDAILAKEVRKLLPSETTGIGRIGKRRPLPVIPMYNSINK